MVKIITVKGILNTSLSRLKVFRDGKRFHMRENDIEKCIKQKSLRFTGGIIYMDGLVSTGKQISQHNIRNNFC